MTLRALAALAALCSAALPPLAAQNTPDDAAAALITAARQQIGVTVRYDPAYVLLSYPGGDVPPEAGVCTDVVVRAYRALGLDLQKLVHEDMRQAFAKYPKIWGLSRPGRNIDHRRVPNLRRFFERQGAALAPTRDPDAFRPGDLVTSTLPGNLPHIMIVSDRRTPDNTRPLVIHNVGAGAQEEDFLLKYPLTGHYRWLPASAGP